MSTADSELAEALSQAMASRLRKAGLVGRYASARSELGDRALSLVRSGAGAYLWGKPGRGKTWAAAHVVREVVEASAPCGRVPARLVTAKGLLDMVRDGFNGGDRGALARVGRVPVLALDDLGAETPTPFSVETLTSLLDARYAAGLPTVVTSNLSLGELSELWGGHAGERIASRIAGMCERIEVGGEDRRLAHV